MQPMEIIASRPTLIMSQPSAMASMDTSGKPSRPEPIQTIFEATPRSAKML